MGTFEQVSRTFVLFFVYGRAVWQFYRIGWILGFQENLERFEQMQLAAQAREMGNENQFLYDSSPSQPLVSEQSINTAKQLYPGDPVDSLSHRYPWNMAGKLSQKMPWQQNFIGAGFNFARQFLAG